MTAEQIRKAVSEYASSNFPGWKCCFVMVRMGGVIDDQDESLLILPPVEHSRPGPRLAIAPSSVSVVEPPRLLG